MKLRLKKPFEVTDCAYIETTALDEAETKVTWGFTGEMTYPMNVLLRFMNMRQTLGTQLNEGIINLKADT